MGIFAPMQTILFFSFTPLTRETVGLAAIGLPLIWVVTALWSAALAYSLEWIAQRLTGFVGRRGS